MNARMHTKHFNHRLGRATRVFPKAPQAASFQTVEGSVSPDELTVNADSIDESLQETIKVPTGPARSKKSADGRRRRSSRSQRSSKTKSKTVMVECGNCRTLWQVKVRHETRLDCEECGDLIVVAAERKSALSKFLSKLTGG